MKIESRRMDDRERPISVSDLRQKFDKKGKAQTPSEFNQAGRASAARHNLAVRMQQVAWNRRQKSTEPSPFEDPRMTGLTDSEITEFILLAVGSYLDRTKALSDILNADVQVGDEEVDALSIKDLRSFIKAKDGDFSTCKRLGDLRLCAIHAKQAWNLKQSSSQEQEEEYSFVVPQLTTALTSGTDDDVNRAILQMFFEEYDQSRLQEIDQLLEKHKGEEDELFAELAWKYPDHANKLVAFSISATYGEGPTPSPALLANSNRRRPSYVISALRA